MFYSLGKRINLYLLNLNSASLFVYVTSAAGDVRVYSTHAVGLETLVSAMNSLSAPEHIEELFTGAVAIQVGRDEVLRAALAGTVVTVSQATAPS